MRETWAVALSVLLLTLLGTGCRENTSQSANGTNAVRGSSGNPSSVAQSTKHSASNRGTSGTKDCDLELVANKVGITEKLRQGEELSFEQLGKRFLKNLVDGGFVDQSSENYSRLNVKLNDIDGNWERFKQYCRAVPLGVDSNETSLCRFGNREIVIPVKPQYWMMVRRQQPGKVSWLFLTEQAMTTRYAESEVTNRRTTRLPRFPKALWIELEDKTRDISEVRYSDTTGHVKVDVRWHGYAIKATHDTLQMLAYKVPIRQEHRSASPEAGYDRGELPVRSRTQIDVAFPSPGIMKVTPRTDSLTEEQRCWLGTHVIDSTAAGLR